MLRSYIKLIHLVALAGVARLCRWQITRTRDIYYMVSTRIDQIVADVMGGDMHD